MGVLALGFASVSLAWSQTLPQGPQVAQGAVSFSQAANQLAITQSTAKAVVNWQSFDIGQNAKVNITQPSSQSVLLNRVLSDNPTHILGQLQANGQVVLVNPKGIVVGSDGSVSASAFTASTLNISDADFMAGKERYTRGDSTGQVINKGRIEVAPGGYVALLGASVSNEGQIIAPQGGVALGAAETVTVPIGRTGKIKLELTPASINASVANQKDGVIVAEGGQVYMQAAALGQAVASVLNSGSIDTSGVQAGAVHLLADGGQIKVDGRITANSSGQDDEGQARKGGDIVIGRDEETGVLAKATDVSGARLESGKGFVETSGDVLSTTGTRVKASEWLLDPTNITIAASGATGTPYTSSYTSGADSIILASDISANLTAGTSVTLATGAGGTSAGNIAVNESISKTGGGDATLTLQAHGNITVAASKTITSNTGKLNVVFNSDSDAAGGGAIIFNTGSGITSKGGDITLGGGTALNGTGSAAGDGISGYAGISLSTAAFDAGGGNIAMTGTTFKTALANTPNVHGIVVTNGSIKTTGAGTITMNGYSTTTTATLSKAIQISGATITGGSTGTVSLIGDSRSAAAAGDYLYGVALGANAVVTSLGGDIAVTGYGGNGSGGLATNIGVSISGAKVAAVGAGKVTVSGTGGQGTVGSNIGVYIDNASTVVSSQGADINIIGQGGNGAKSVGVLIGGGTVGVAAGTTSANVILTTDSVQLQTSTINSGAGTTTIQNKTAGTLVNVGGADVLNATQLTLGITNAEMNLIKAGTLKIGSTTSGAMTTTAAVTTAATTGNVYLQSGSTLTASSAFTSGAGLLLQTTGGAISTTAALAGTNVSLDNTGGTINWSSGALTAGANSGSATNAVNIASSITATGNVNILGNVATTTNTGVNLTNAGSITSSGTAATINITSNGNLVNSAAIKDTGATGTGSNINLTSTSGTITGAGAIGDTTNKNASVTFTQSGTSTYDGAINAANFTKAGTGALTLGSWIATPSMATNVSNAYTVKDGGSLTLSTTPAGSQSYAQLNPTSINVENASTFSLAPSNLSWVKNTAFNFTGGMGGGIMNLGGNPIGQGGTTNSFSTSGGATNTITGTLNANSADVNFNLTPATSGTTLLDSSFAALAFTQSSTNYGLGSGGGGATTVNMSGGGNLLIKDKFRATNFNINAGNVQVGDGTAATASTTATLDATNIGIAAGTKLTFNRAEAYRNDSIITGTGSLVQAGSGVVTLTGNSTAFAGATTVNAGKTLAIGSYTNTATPAVTFVGSLGAAGSTLTLTDSGSNLSFTNTSGTSTVASTISGPGTVTENGAGGTGVLLANNTYTGITTTTAGTLQVGNGGTTGSLGTGSVTDNSALVFKRSDNITVTNAISGSGTVTQAGTGVLTFPQVGTGTVNNTYTGQTYVNAGTMSLKATSNLAQYGTGQFNIASGATLNFDVTSGINTTAYTNTTFAGNGTISKTGAGQVVWNTTAATFNLGAGSLIDVQAGTFVGGSNSNENWTNNLSSLNVASGATFAGSEGNIRVDALTGAGSISTGYSTAGSITVGVNGTTAGTYNPTAGVATFSGVISSTTNNTGVTSLSKVGAGTQILTGTNTYKGITSIGAGTLQVGDGGTTGTLGTGAVEDNGNLTINRSDTYTVANAISGTGSFSQIGVGTTKLTADNTYAGTTTVSGGTLQVGNAGTTGTLGAGDVTLSNNANLSYVLAEATTIANNISGAGNVSAAITGATSDLTVNRTIALTGGTVNLNADRNLSVTQAISTTNGTSSAVTLVAGKPASAGTATGGDVTISGSGSVSAGASGRVTFMTGSLAGSTGVGAVTGNNRYNSDEVDTNYTAALASGTYTIYREQPLVTVQVNNASKTYDGLGFTGGSLSGAVTSGALIKGDTFAAVTANAAYGGSSQGAKNASPTTYEISGSDAGGKSALGYGVTYTSGALTVNKANLTVTANNDARFVGRTDNTSYAGVSYAGFVNGETSAVLGGTLAITRTNSDMGAGVYAGVLSANGLTSGNYNIAYTPGTYTIVPADQLLIKTANTTVTYGTAPVYETTAQYLDSNSDEIITLTRTGTDNNYTFNDGLGTTISATLKPYAGTSLASTSTSGNTVVGTYSIKDLNPIVNGGNFVGAPVFVGNLTVSTQEITPNASGVTKVYDGTTAMNNVVVGLTGKLNADTVSISGSGAFSQKHAGTGLGYTVSNIALSGADASNYHLAGDKSSFSGTDGVITTATLKLTTSNVSKTYDGTTNAVGSAVATQSTQLFGTDTVSGGTFAFTNKNAGTGNKVVTVSGVTIDDGNNGGNYSVTYVDNTTSTINKANLTLKAVTDTKTYDGTVASNKTVEVINASGSTDVVTVAQEFASKNALGLNASTLQLTSGYTIKDTGGADMSGNYTVTTQTALGTILKKDVTLDSIAAANKIYDGGNTANITSGVIATGVGSETLSVSGSGTFSDKHVADGKTVTVADVTALSKTDGSGSWANYNLSTTGALTTTANISPRALSLSAVTDTKTYDGTTSSSGVVAISGHQVGDTITATQVFDSKHALGTGASTLKVGTFTINDGNDGKNYSVTQNTATGTIQKASLTVTATQVEKTYDGTTSATGTGTVGTLAGQAAGESVNAAGSQAFVSKNASTGDKHVKASGVTIKDSANADVTQNYDIHYVDNTTSTIHKANLSVAMSNQTKVYDGTTQADLAAGAITATGVTVNGVTETASVTQTTGTYNDKNVANANTVTATLQASHFTSGTADVGNYNLPTTVSNTASSITKANLAVTLAKQTKVYDGTTAASLAAGAITATGVTVGGVTETASVTQTAGSYNSKNVATANTVTATLAAGHFTAGTADLGNYNLPTTVSNTSSTITQAPLTLTANSDLTKVYNGSEQSVSGFAITSGNLQGTDSVAVDLASITAGAQATHAGTHTSTVNDSAYTNGNYAITKVNGTLFIDQKEVSLAAAKTYDGSKTLTGTQLSISTGVGTETLGFTQASIHSKNVADNSVNFVDAVTLSNGSNGGLASNYKLPALTAGVNNSVVLSAKALTGTIADVTTTYGTAAATGAVSLSGKVGTDDVLAASTPTLVSAATSTSGQLKAGSYVQTVSAGLTGADAGNYSFAGSTTPTANYVVNKLALTGAIAQGLTTYSNTLVAGAVSLTNTVSGDDVLASGVNIDTTGKTSTSGHLKAGVHMGIQTLTGLTGADKDNYSFANIQGDYKVNPLALTGSITKGESTYGANLLTGTVNLTNKVGTDVVDASGVSIDTSGQLSTSGHLKAGEHAAIQSISGLTGSDKDNYTFADVKGDYKVNKLALNGGIAQGESIYGSALQSGAVSFTNKLGTDVVNANGVNIDTTGKTSNSGHLKAGVHTGIQTLTGLTGADMENYSFEGIKGDYKVNQLALTGAAIADVTSTYGTAADAGAVSFTNVKVADKVTALASIVDAATSTSTSGHLKVGSYKQTATVISGDDAANYSFAGVTTSNANYSVSKKDLVISASANNKVYDATTTASASLISDMLSGDSLSLSSTSANFDTKNVGTSKTVTVNGLAISGTDAGNYNLTNTSTSTTANISKKDLVISASANNKVYDATTTASASLSSDQLAGDSLSLSSTSANFDTKNVGTNKTVTVNGLAISGTDAGNYNLTNFNTSTTANITKAELTLKAVADEKIYDGKVSSDKAVTVINNSAGADIVIASQEFASKNVLGNNGSTLQVTSGLSIRDTDGADMSGNYTIKTETAKGTITPKAITLSGITANSKTYDGNTTALVSTAFAHFDGKVSGDDLSVASTGTFSDKNAAKGKTVNLVNSLRGADLGNYTVTDQKTTQADIHKKALTVSGLTANNKVYDGQTQAEITTHSAILDGMIQGDDVKVLATGTFDTRHVGQDKTVTLSSTFEGVDVDNYSITLQSFTTAHITPAPLQVKASAVRKTYDGTTLAQGSGIVVGTLAGALAGDKVESGGTLSFKDKNAGTGKTVTVQGVRLIDGTQTDVTGNYSIEYIDSKEGVIDRANASISAPATSVTYNGQTQSQTGAALSGFLPGDQVQAAGLAQGRHVGTYGSALTATGADVQNYNISFHNAPLTIGKKAASLSSLDQSVVYNGLNQQLSGTQNSGFIAGDALSFNGLPSGRDVGQYTSALTVSGADAGNYEITVGNGKLTITPKEASVKALDESVVYNGNIHKQSTYEQQGFIAGDAIVVSGLASGRNAGIYSSDLKISGADAKNYAVRLQQGNLSVQKARLSFTGTSAADKLADGTTVAQVKAGSIVGLVGTETLAITSVSGQFDSPVAGTGKDVHVVYGQGNGLNGGLSANYDWSPAVVKANITAPGNSNLVVKELAAPKNTYSRLYFQGFGGLGGVGAATGQASYAVQPHKTQACSPQKLEDCLCESLSESLIEICYPVEQGQQALR